MKKTHYSLLAISIALASQVHAAGFQVVEHSASGLGRAFSGDGAIGDNASEISANPAIMTRFDKAQFSGALSVVDPKINIYDETTDQMAKDVAPFQAVPASYYVSPINDKWAWGFGLYTTYGVTTDYPTDIAAGDISGKTSLVSVNINPNIAYKVNDHFSIGAGVNFLYAIAELERTQGALSQFTGGSPSDHLIKMEGDTLGYGWNIGALFELNENNRFSASYRSAVNLKFEDGDFTDYTGSILGAPNSIKADLEIELPDIVELAGFHQLDERWAVHYSWQWTNYSIFEELKAESSQCPTNVCFSKKEYYDDNQRWAIGTTFQPLDQWIFRAGFAFDQRAGEPTLSIPDSDRYWYSTGLTYLWSDNLSIDGGLTIVRSKDGKFEETNNLDQVSTFHSSGLAYIAAIQLNYTFN